MSSLDTKVSAAPDPQERAADVAGTPGSKEDDPYHGEGRRVVPLTQPGHETGEESGSDEEEGGLLRNDRGVAANLVSPLPLAGEECGAEEKPESTKQRSEALKRKVESFAGRKNLFGVDDSEGRKVKAKAKAPVDHRKEKRTEGEKTPRQKPATAGLSPMSNPAWEKSKTLKPVGGSAEERLVKEGCSERTGAVVSAVVKPVVKWKEVGVDQSVLAEDQLAALLNEPDANVAPDVAMRDMAMGFVAFDDRRPADWMRLVCAANNRYYKLYLERRFKSLDLVERELNRIVQSVSKTFLNAETPFDSEEVVCRMMAVNQMLLIRSKRQEQAEEALLRIERMGLEETALKAIEAADVTPQKVIDWRNNNDEFQAGESPEDEGPVCNKKPAANRKTAKRVLLGRGPVRIDCRHWKNFKGADRVILGVGTMEYDRDGNVWYTRAKEGL